VVLPGPGGLPVVGDLIRSGFVPPLFRHNGAKPDLSRGTLRGQAGAQLPRCLFALCLCVADLLLTRPGHLLGEPGGDLQAHPQELADLAVGVADLVVL